MSDNTDVIIAIDFSMTGELTDDIIEAAKYIINKDSESIFTVFEFGGKVHADYHIERVEDIPKKSSHRGISGTDFRVVWERMVTRNRIPSHLYMITDGYASMDRIKDFAEYCQTTWLVIDGGNSKMPFGDVVNNKEI